MKKIILTVCLMISSLICFAQDKSEEALNFVQSYISAANSYSSTLPSYYLPSAKIIRVVEKKTGGTATVVTDMKEYTKQLKLGAMGAKVSKYKNYYSNLKVTEIDENTYKVSGLRRPSGESYSLPVYFIVKKISGTWKIIEESMNTRVQTFLKYAN